MDKMVKAKFLTSEGEIYMWEETSMSPVGMD